MKEIRQIIEMWRDQGGAVLATLIKARGSSYRRPGARLLIGDQSHYAGTISGGCLEAEVIRKAAWLVRQGAAVERYSTEFDDTSEIPFGLGCGGVVDLLFEPTDTAEFDALIAALEGAVAGAETAVFTWLPRRGRALSRAVMTPGGDLLFASQNLTESMLREISTSMADRLEPLSEEIFQERIVPLQRVFILGAGDDAKPLVRMGALLGWVMLVLDGRPHLARRERFPEAENVEVIRASSLALQNVSPRDAVVLMTHSYEQDRDFLAAVLPLRPGYIGVLGARHRTALLLSDASKTIGWSIEECCSCVHAPVGLDLGGDGPEVIALSVIAEVQAIRMGKVGNSRKLTATDVETFAKERHPEEFLQTDCSLAPQ